LRVGVPVGLRDGFTTDGGRPGRLARYTPVLARINDVKFKSIVKPGDELIIDVRLKDASVASCF